uniref:Cytochrome c biogenesis protein Ccs1 n=1 Tax=Chondria sp. (in: red algae) TaxID=1982705 RepID=A0A1Z1MDT6_9FLOR|nr:cytochrome c biogenesis protein ccs1 [Chondria sp. (in: red algae)]
MKIIYTKNRLWNLFKYLSNLNLSISILFLISFFCFLGSVIEQDQNLLYYQVNYPISDVNVFNLNWKTIMYFGLDHVFQTGWFILILIVFMSTLISCTLFTQLPSLKNARRWKFFYSTNSITQKVSFEEHYPRQDNSFVIMVYSLLNSSFFVFCHKNSLYAYKGLYGRVSPIFVHLSLVSILIGSIFSFLSGFTAQEMVPNGEIFHVRHIIKSGLFSSLPSNIFGRVENFYLKYNPDSSIKQFFSKISLLSSNNYSITSRVLFVNQPFYYYNLVLYQIDWQIDAIKFCINNSGNLQKQLVKTTINGKNCWLCRLPVTNHQQVFFAIFNLKDPIVIFDSVGKILGKISIHEVFYINNIHFVIDDVMMSTGIQIKADRGIIIVYFGFFILILSTVLSYLSYSQVWFYESNFSFKLSALTNRAVLFFEGDIISINKSYNFYVLSNILQNQYIKNFILQ